MARRAAVAAALAVHNRVPVWIVDCNISADRMRAYRQAGAHIVTLTVDRAELHARAARERPGLWHALIDAWTPSTAVTHSSRDW